MKTPLAHFRGYQIASGVGLKTPPLQEVILRRYFYKERLARIAETEALAQAMISTATKDGAAADKAMRKLKGILFPEIEEETEEFGKKSLPIMQAWRDRVISIETVKVGKKGIGGIAKIHKISDVIDELRKIKPIPKEERRPNPFKGRARGIG